MGFSEAINTCLKQKYATFQGRAARSEYWYFTLFYFLVLLAAGIFAGVVIGMAGDPSGPIVFIAALPSIIVVFGLLLPLISVCVRRLHDRDMSGWWYLGFIVLGAIPYVGFLFSIGFLVLTCLKGTEGPNRFGRDPLGAQTSADVFA